VLCRGLKLLVVPMLLESEVLLLRLLESRLLVPRLLESRLLVPRLLERARLLVRVFRKVREDGGDRDEGGLETTAYKSPDAGWRWWREGECGEMPRTLPPAASGGVTAALEYEREELTVLAGDNAEAGGSVGENVE